MTTQQPEALDLANWLDAVGNGGISSTAAAAELRRQHTRIAELEAQLESIGAGGVSGPLMGRTDSKEREAFERALMDLAAQHGETVSTSDLSRDASGAYDNGMTEIAWMLWQARASIAASAGSEPVAWVDERVISWLANSRSRSATISTTLEKGKSSERPNAPLHPPLSPRGDGGRVDAD